ncbi:MAG: NUDIX hydrolase [Cryomorphaceae bacterium]|nr:NUDIX hydrolase [Cryomorphaceae bacterium]
MEKDTINDWKRLSSKVVYDNAWISVFHEDVINPNGGKSIYGRVHFKNVAIGILPVDEDGNTWLVGQSRYPLGIYTWEIPEGGGPLDEDLLLSAKRELAEEIGMEADYWEVIQEADLSNSATDERTVIFLATGLRPTASVSQDETERLLVKKVSMQTFFDMVDSGEIRDALSVLAALRYRLLKSTR